MRRRATGGAAALVVGVGLCLGGGQLARAQPATPDDGEAGRREAALRARVQVSPTDLPALRELAELLERTGRMQAAVSLRRRILAGATGEAEVARAQMELAVGLVEAGRSAEAVPLLEGLTAKQPTDEPAFFELGTALARQEAFVRAYEAFRRAVSLRPKDAEAQLSAAKTLVTLLRYAEAEPYLEAAAREGASPLQAHQIRGVIYRYTGREGLAIGEFAAAARLDANDAALQLELGEVLRLGSRYAEAADALERSVRLKPSVGGYFQLAKVYRALGREESKRSATGALKALEEEQAKATRVAALLKEAEREIAEGRLEQAGGTYDAAQKLQPQDVEVFYRHALLDGLRQDAAGERGLLDEVLRRSPRHAGALVELGKMEGAAGEDAAAKRHLGEALQSEPENVEALSNLGVIEARGGNLATGERRLREAVEGDAASAAAYRNLGLVYAAEGRLVEAETALGKSEQIAPGEVQTKLALAQVYVSEKRLPQAVAVLLPVVQAAPRDVRALLLLARVFLEQGDATKALEMTERVLEEVPGQADALGLRKEVCSGPERSRVAVACDVVRRGQAKL